MYFGNKAIKYILIILISYYLLKKNIVVIKNPSFIKLEQYNLSEYFINNDNLFFNISSIKLSNIERKMIQIEYFINFYSNSKGQILPSDLTLYNKLEIFCYIKIIQNNNIIISIPTIEKNMYFKCIEIIYFNDTVQFGIKINDDSNNYYRVIILFSTLNKLFYKYITNSNIKLNCSSLQKDYSILLSQIHNKSDNSLINKRLKKSYLFMTKCTTKNYNISENNWHFRNKFNQSFCFCVGMQCLYKKVKEKCKYLLYLNIIDDNKDIYNKTDYLFNDFVNNELSSDDTFPIFEEMYKQNIPAHYLTENIKIYQKYCNYKSHCNSIIHVGKNDIIDGTFLQKYLTLFLKLKAVITGAEFFFINNLFYKIDYITYISVGHGISFFKYFLYEPTAYYGNKIYNKILIPPSKKLIKMATKYKWNENDIIKINLPRWHFYDEYNITKPFENKSIFVMFTWRHSIKRKHKNKTVCEDYIDNINKLLNNDELNQDLEKRNITLYFTLHHKYLIYKANISFNKNIHYINETQISDILKSTNLIVTDFSSIIFDIIYRQKPFIIYIPDSNETKIINNYDNYYVKLIQELKNNQIKFENKFFTLNETIKKILFYIKNDFKLEPRLKKFYEDFGFEHYNGIKKFINYLVNL